jgi:protein TonB
MTSEPATRLSPARIAAYSGALAVHAVAFAFLLMPITYQHVAKPLVEEWVWIDPLPEVKPVPPPVPPPTVRPQERHQDRIKIHQDRVIFEKPDTDFVEHVEPPVGPAIDEPVEKIVDTGPVAPAGPAPTVQLAYIYAPINYSPSLLRKHIEGTVMLRVLVDREGLPAKIELEKSSGNGELDRSALSQVTRWQFQPAVKDGRNIEVWAIVPVKFAIDRA